MELTREQLVQIREGVEKIGYDVRGLVHEDMSRLIMEEAKKADGGEIPFNTFAHMVLHESNTFTVRLVQQVIAQLTDALFGPQAEAGKEGAPE